MTKLRAQKIATIADSLPPTAIYGDQAGDLLIIGWGSTRGAIEGAVKELRTEGKTVGHVHLRYLNPLPKDLAEIMSRFKHVLVPELNCGQLLSVLRAKFAMDLKGFSKVQGQPLKIRELKEEVGTLFGRAA